jgi:hypothetical protein
MCLPLLPVNSGHCSEMPYSSALSAVRRHALRKRRLDETSHNSCQRAQMKARKPSGGGMPGVRRLRKLLGNLCCSRSVVLPSWKSRVMPVVLVIYGKWKDSVSIVLPEITGLQIVVTQLSVGGATAPDTSQPAVCLCAGLLLWRSSAIKRAPSFSILPRSSTTLHPPFSPRHPSLSGLVAWLSSTSLGDLSMMSVTFLSRRRLEIGSSSSKPTHRKG